jgi:hypothetical protein
MNSKSGMARLAAASPDQGNDGDVALMVVTALAGRADCPGSIRDKRASHLVLGMRRVP